MERRQAEAIRDLERGQFLGLGPAIARRPVLVRVGPVRTGSNNAAPVLLPLPGAGDVELLQNIAVPAPQTHSFRAQSRNGPELSSQPDARVSTSLDTNGTGAGLELPLPAPPALPTLSDEDREGRIRAILAGSAAAFVGQPLPILYGEFVIGCRMAGLSPVPEMAEFRRRFAFALVGIENLDGWDDALALAAALPEEMLAPFLAIARAAREGVDCPSDAELARIYGTASLGRVRRMLGHMEERGVIVTRVDLAGARSIALPHLGWTTAATEAGRAA
jgi:hypothetical protein